MTEQKPPQKRLIVEAIGKVMMAVNTIPKTGYNSHHRYKFSSESDILNLIRPEMILNGLVLIPFHQEILNVTEGKQYRVDMRLQYALIHESGDSLQVEVLSSGVDSQDKAIPKALTMGLKYAMIQLFCLPRGDDPDQDQPKSFSLFKNARFSRFAEKHGGYEKINQVCAHNGWPLPSSWTEDKMNRFIGAVERGEIEL